MKPLNFNERRLLGLLGLIFFLGGNFFAYRWFQQTEQKLTLQEAELRADKAEALVVLQDEEKWAGREKWIEAHQPPLADAATVQADVLQNVLKTARDQQLEILDQNLGGITPTPSGRRVDVSLKVKGSLQSLCLWLSNLQTPTSFFAITLFTLKADEDQKSMVCTLQISRYFQAGKAS